jgi:hypothetical protein
MSNHSDFNSSPEVIRLVAMMYVRYFEVGEVMAPGRGEKPPTGFLAMPSSWEGGRILPEETLAPGAAAGYGLPSPAEGWTSLSAPHLAELTTAGRVLGSSNSARLN